MSFDITKYDTGGWSAIANDGRLTGSEVLKARKDNWLVFEGYNSNDPTPEKHFYINFMTVMETKLKDFDNKRYYTNPEKPYSYYNVFEMQKKTSNLEHINKLVSNQRLR